MNTPTIFQAMFEEATIGILAVRASGEIVKANPFVEKMFGYEKGEMLGLPLENLLPESCRTQHVQHRKGFNERPVHRTMGADLDLYGLRKSGDKFPVHISLSFMKSEDGQLTIAYIHDVTKEKQLTKELHWKSIAIASGLIPIALADLEGKLIEVNEAFAKLWGYDDAKELIGLDNQALSSTHGELSEINKAIREKGHWAGESKAKKKDGSYFYIFATANLVVDDQNHPQAMLASFIDITALKKAQALSQDIFKIVDDSLNEIYIFDAETLQFIHVNKGARNNIGYTLEEMRQMTPVDIKPKHTEASFMELIAPLLNGEKEIILFDTVHRRKDGTSYPVEEHLQYSMLGDQPVLVAIIIDITVAEKAKEALQDSNTQLEEKVKLRTKALQEKEAELEQALAKEKELNGLKSRFVSMASHEFRTPLSSILASSGLIARYPETDQQDKRMKHIEKIKSAVSNLTNILNDFLSLEKLESGMISCQKVEVDVINFVATLLDEMKLVYNEDQTIRHEHSGGTIVLIDEYLVKNVLINLLSNAFKYSPSGKNVDLISSTEKDMITIKVRDYGIGIPEQDQPHMFGRFFRATNVANIQGTGLGLVIVKRYLDLMGGSIDFESKENEGTTFIVEIPQ
jgi:PAS domain S-box-containing protein